MNKIVYFLLSLKLFFVSGSISKLVLHKNFGDEVYSIKGDQCGSGALFSVYEDFSCACVTGLWALYKENCEQAYMLLAGTDGQCSHIDFPVQKVNLLSPEENSAYLSSLAVFDPFVASLGGKFIASKESLVESHFAPAGYPIAITTGEQTWRLPLQKICLKPKLANVSTPQFCAFNMKILEEYRIDSSPCGEKDTLLYPLSCTMYSDELDSESRTCSKRFRRKVMKNFAQKRKSSRQSGRAFLETITGFKEEEGEGEGGGGSDDGNSTNSSAADENMGIYASADSPVMNSELWNYMTLRAQEMLGIRERRRKDPSDSSYEASFAFLEIAKEIQQKACPNHYVTDEHYDIACGAFISILKNHYKYTDPFLDFPTSERIEDTLRACLANITEYPFLERTAKPRPDMECNDTQPVEHGAYFAFEQQFELTLAHDQASRSNEPIVETVWKIFTHAHSACYPFFEKNLNDHHRFATVMLQLFTSEINDLWFNITELTPDIYTGFLGNAVDLMDSVAYCSGFSRLESKYPWDLPRPAKDNAAKGAGGGGGDTGGGGGGTRRRREIGNELDDFRCLQERDATNFCPYLNGNLEISI